MAYSDYGGRVYRNGERREDRCDAVLSPEGIQSTPGSWPGWTIESARNANCYHALLGDGPIFVGMMKQSFISIRRYDVAVPLLSCLKEQIEGGVQEWDETRLNHDAWRKAERTAEFEVDGHKIEVRWMEEDNYYVYVRLTHPDHTVWTGWSGYGVGAGLEDDETGFSDRGFSSAERDKMLAEIFPSSS